jgi:hypothetical protein
MISEKPNRSLICSLLQPNALRKTVTAWRRLRSMRTPTVSRLSMSNSSHAPRLGITLTLCSSFSVDLSMVPSKYTPGERTSWLTTTRSVPLMMKVPFSVIIGKSPMNTVWLLISPVLLLMNSAVTNSGAAYVMSLSLHSSTGALTSSKRGSEKDSDIEPEKSSIGDSSYSTSSSPPTGLASPVLAPRVTADSRQRGAPISHSNESVCTSSKPGTSSGSRSLANEMRSGAPGTELLEEVEL